MLLFTGYIFSAMFNIFGVGVVMSSFLQEKVSIKIKQDKPNKRFFKFNMRLAELIYGQYYFKG